MIEKMLYATRLSEEELIKLLNIKNRSVIDSVRPVWNESGNLKIEHLQTMSKVAVYYAVLETWRQQLVEADNAIEEMMGLLKQRLTANDSPVESDA